MQAFVEVDGVLSSDNLLLPTLGLLHHCYLLTSPVYIKNTKIRFVLNETYKIRRVSLWAEIIPFDSENAAMRREEEETETLELNSREGFSHIIQSIKP